jgi:hypothetical protein
VWRNSQCKPIRIRARHLCASATGEAGGQASKRSSACVGAPFPTLSPSVPASLNASFPPPRAFPGRSVPVPGYSCSPASTDVPPLTPSFSVQGPFDAPTPQLGTAPAFTHSALSDPAVTSGFPPPGPLPSPQHAQHAADMPSTPLSCRDRRTEPPPPVVPAPPRLRSHPLLQPKQYYFMEASSNLVT